MSIDNKYGVPIKDDVDERGALIQPKFTNRFRVLFQDLGHSGDLNVDMNARQYLTAQVESFSRPNIEFGNKPVTSFIGRGFVSGRPMMGDFKFVIRDDITNSAISYLYMQIQSNIDKFYPQQNTNGRTVLNKQLGRNTKFNVLMEVMDGRTNHTAIEVWDFYGCQFNSVQFTDYSYESDSEIATISVSCSFDSMRVYRPEKNMFASREYDNANSAKDARIATLEKASGIVDKIEEEGGTLVAKGVNKVKGWLGLG